MDVEELVHVHRGEAGLPRERRGDRFAYRDAEGERVTDPETLARIAALKIPPAWTVVWIAAAPNAHLQAHGARRQGATPDLVNYAPGTYDAVVSVA